MKAVKQGYLVVKKDIVYYEEIIVIKFYVYNNMVWKKYKVKNN